MSKAVDPQGERVLILASAADATALQGAAAACGFHSHACSSLTDLSEALPEGAGVMLLTEDALAASSPAPLVDALRRQPAWSDVPVILLTASGAESPRTLQAAEKLGHVSLLEKPPRRSVLQSMLRTAIRTRRRQYQLRDQIHERQVTELRFRLAAEAVNGIIYEYDRVSGHVERIRGLFEVLGYHPEEVPPTAQWWAEQMHPDDRARLLPGMPDLPQGTLHKLEYRVRHRDGRWLHVEDRAFVLSNVQGQPVRLIGCTTDVTAQRELEAALREQDQRKDEFLAMLAHELRNPLAPIRNAVHILRLRDSDAPDIEAARAMIDRQVNHLVRLVDDLLDVSRCSRGKVQLKMTPIELGAVARQAVETSRPLIDARKHRLCLSLPHEPMQIEGDFTRLTQVISNLLNNAAKYTDEGGEILLGVERELRRGEELAVLRVRDNGRGIEPPVLAHLFDLFYQVERNLDRADGGLGIGLSLVKNLVELHGGRVEAHSAGRGKGSEFTVRLPLLAATPAASCSATAFQKPIQAARILVVDDNVDSADSMAILLRLEGHKVMTATDGPQAVELALRERPDVVLLDIRLPQLNGLQACQAMRQGGLKDALIIAMTGYGQEEDRRRSRLADFDAHLVKPVDLGTLQQLLLERSHPDQAT